VVVLANTPRKETIMRAQALIAGIAILTLALVLTAIAQGSTPTQHRSALPLCRSLPVDPNPALRAHPACRP
jgi:hypothetical protein